MALTISQKLLLTPVLGTLSLLLLLAVTVAIGQENEIVLARIQNNYAPSLELSRDLVDLLATTQRALQFAVASEDEEALAEADLQEQAFLARLSAGSASSQIAPARIASLKSEFASYYQLARRVSTQLIHKQSGEDVTETQRAMAAQYNGVRTRLETNALDDKREMDASFVRASGYMRTTTEVEALFILAWAAIVGFFSIRLSRQLSGRVTRLRNASVLLGEGKPAPSVEDGGKDELGELAVSINQMAKSLSAARETAEAARVAARLRSVLDASLDAIMVVDPLGMVVDWNAGAERIFGWTREEVTGRAIDSLLGALGDDRSMQTLRDGGVPARLEASLKRRSGGEFIAELRFGLLATQTEKLVIVFCRDLTRDRALELELRQAQKLESVGRLAAGLAHEINTPIQFVSHSIHFVREAVSELFPLLGKYRQLEAAVATGSAAPAQLEELAEARGRADLDYLLEHVPRALERSVEGLDRVVTIVRSMKEFAHPDQKEMALVDLNQAVESTLTIARNEYKLVAEAETKLGSIPRVLCYAGEVNQALLNIIVNAAHAIEDVVRGTDQKGRILIETAPDGDGVAISISDTGCGIPPEIRDRIFDPFFTTKEVGRGTGQGLAIAHSVVHDKHGGRLTFTSEMGVGTTFTIWLPLEGKRSPNKQEVVVDPQQAPASQQSA